jgi:hypothetical protein
MRITRVVTPRFLKASRSRKISGPGFSDRFEAQSFNVAQHERTGSQERSARSFLFAPYKGQTILNFLAWRILTSCDGKRGMTHELR